MSVRDILVSLIPPNQNDVFWQEADPNYLTNNSRVINVYFTRNEDVPMNIFRYQEITNTYNYSWFVLFDEISKKYKKTDKWSLGFKLFHLLTHHLIEWELCDTWYGNDQEYKTLLLEIIKPQ